MTTVVNKTPFLRNQRHFPQEQQPLAVELNRSYTDIANAVNSRVIGVFPTNLPSITGEEWFVTSQKQQTLRQIYKVTGTGNIAHGINVATISAFTRIFGTFTDNTIWYPLPYVDATAANNQISLTVTATNIVITAGGGSPPTVSSGFVVLEWLSNP